MPQGPARKGADTESGQLTFNNACRTAIRPRKGDNRFGPNLHNIIGRKAGSLSNYGYGADFVWVMAFKANYRRDRAERQRAALPEAL
jgi:cytochrome c